MSTDCLFCESQRQELVLSLGNQPLANSYLSAEQLAAPEPTYPLDLYVCADCMLAHINVAASGEDIFSDYAYFSSFSTTWLEHARRYTGMIAERLELGPSSFVVEIASNDGYLLQYFKERGIPCLGVEPAANVAEAAREKGIETFTGFFGAETSETLARAHAPADLVIGNNVLAHTPDPNDLIEGIRRMLGPGGAATLEFPHLYRLIEENQFDTIYHEHFSYFSFSVVQRMFAAHGLTLFDVEELPTHGGSLRIYARHEDDVSQPITPAVGALLEREGAAGMADMNYYRDFARKVEGVRTGLLAFLEEARAAGKRVAGYGAPAKGNTLLNYCKAGPDLIAYTLDRSPHKQGLYLPGSHIPIRAPEFAREDKPGYLLILPWNLKDEIMEQMADIREWGGQFAVPIPTLEVLP